MFQHYLYIKIVYWNRHSFYLDLLYIIFLLKIYNMNILYGFIQKSVLYCTVLFCTVFDTVILYSHT